MKRVLAIRPDPALLQALAWTMTPGGREMEVCEGNVEAVRRLRDRAVDVVVTDAATAFNEDLALAVELRQIRPGVKVIVLAPQASQLELVEAMRRHVFACFTLPFEYLDIADMVRTALRTETWRDGIEVVSGAPEWMTLRVSCHLVTADRLVRFMTEYQPSLPSVERDRLMAAFREMLLNAMEHGAGFDPEKAIEVTAARTARAIVYHFRDPGPGFCRADLAHAAASSTPEDVVISAIERSAIGMRPGGFGMLIARQIVDEVIYNERGNEVLLIKHLS
jgi:anti-sigma regulatory factor (Ser/Thr protein kinase)/ActR/RegA family two-component response regulator